MSEVQTILKKYYYDSEIGFLSGKKPYQKLQSDSIKNISVYTFPTLGIHLKFIAIV